MHHDAVDLERLRVVHSHCALDGQAVGPGGARCANPLRPGAHDGANLLGHHVGAAVLCGATRDALILDHCLLHMRHRSHVRGGDVKVVRCRSHVAPGLPPVGIGHLAPRNARPCAASIHADHFPFSAVLYADMQMTARRRHDAAAFCGAHGHVSRQSRPP